MSSESEFMSKLMEETIAENITSSRSEPLSHNDILCLQDKLFNAYPIEVYSSYLRISFEHGRPIDIPRGMGFFHNEEEVFGHYENYPIFEMEIVDETFRSVISDHLFMRVDKAIIFKYQKISYIVFCDTKYEHRVWGHIHNFIGNEYKRSA